MKNRNKVSGNLKKAYEKPTIKAVVKLTDDICMVSVSQQKPPKDGKQSNSLLESESQEKSWLEPVKAWDNSKDEE